MTTTTATLAATKLLLAEGCVYELRILNTSKATGSGYFNDFDKLAAGAAAWNGKAPGVYVTLNPVNPDLLARATNRLREFAKQGATTSDTDIVRRRWLPIDCDPMRPTGISSTDAEHEEAIARVKTISSWLRCQGWPPPILADSGNGGHLLYRIDLPNDQDSMVLVQRCLEALDLTFSDEVVKVDVTNYNAARIWKLYGTKAAKGDSTKERPHRVSSVLYAPSDVKQVDVTLMQSLATTSPRPEPAGRKVTGESFDLAAWIQANDLNVVRTGPWMGGTKWILNPCHWDSDHIDDSSYLVQFASGAIAAGCHHNGCAGKNWKALRELLEPHAGLRHRPSAASGNGAAPESPALDEDVHETDLGNAIRLVARHGQELRYCFPQRKWYAWDGTRWAPDDTGEIHRRAKETVRAIYHEAAEAEGDRGKKLANHAIRSESEAKIVAMMKLARSEPGIPILPTQLDADPWAFNVTTGTIDLRTGTLREHQRGDLITKLAPVTYDPAATAPVFMEFLDTIMDGNAGLITYLQRTLGHTLSGDMSEQRIEMWLGGGANGKTTLFNAMVDVMGSYARPAAPGLLLTSRHDRHPTEVADLKGARFVYGVEVGEGRGLAEETVKRLTGERTLNARRMREDFSEFEASHKLFIAMNHKPTIRGGDHAIWRRIKLTLFNVTIPDADQDKQLGAKLRAERAGIFNWLLAGFLDWQRDGFAEPPEVTAATLTYRTEQDVIARFIEDVCTTGPTRIAAASQLFNAWTKWCAENHERPGTTTAFGNRLREQGFTPGQATTGSRSRIWTSIGLRAQEELTPDSAQEQADG